jgi:hypothetical protein
MRNLVRTSFYVSTRISGSIAIKFFNYYCYYYHCDGGVESKHKHKLISPRTDNSITVIFVLLFFLENYTGVPKKEDESITPLFIGRF